MCLSPKYEYVTPNSAKPDEERLGKLVPPNTGRTFWLFEEIQQRFILALPAKRYWSGCQILAHAAARVLQLCGVPARARLCLQPQDGKGFKGHVVVDQEGLLLDFKAATYVRNRDGKVVAQLHSFLQEQGWCPPNKPYTDVTPQALRQMYPEQRENLNSLAGKTEDLLEKDMFFFVRDFNFCVNSCSDLFD